MYEKFVKLARSFKGIKPIENKVFIINSNTYNKVKDFLQINYPYIKFETSKYCPKDLIMEKPKIELEKFAIPLSF